MAIQLKSKKIAFLFFIASFSIKYASAASQQDDSSQTRFYSDVGRIQWAIPSRDYFYFAVPHFTVGPRIKCGPKAQADCEIQVSARQLTITSEQRRAELMEAAKPYFAEALETTHEIRSFGPRPSVEYIELTHNKDGAKVALGHFITGPYAVKFHFLARDPDGSKLKQVLQLIRSAEALDGMAYLAYRLTDFKAGCEELFPDLRLVNDEAFSRSKFADVNYIKYFVEASPSVSKEDTESKLLKARQNFIEAMRQWPKEESLNFCRTYPKQVSAAED